MQNNEFLLEGSVDGNGAAITNASLVATSAGGTTHGGSIYPALIQSEVGFGPVRLNGLLFDPQPGFNDVAVTATNCRGTASSVTRRVIWSPIAPTTRFRRLGQIEVTQSTQTPLDSVPLIAASPNGASGPSPASTCGSRTVRPRSATSPGASPPSAQTARARPARCACSRSTRLRATRSSRRGRSSRSARAGSPAAAVRAAAGVAGRGQMHLPLEHIYIEDTESRYPCDECDNRGPLGNPLGQIGPSTVRFHETPPVRLWLVGSPTGQRRAHSSRWSRANWRSTAWRRRSGACTRPPTCS